MSSALTHPAEGSRSCRGFQVLEALRSRTRPWHVRVYSNSAFSRLFDKEFTLSDYREHLSSLLGILDPLEAAIEKIAGPSDLSARALKRADKIREDLELMGSPRGEIDGIERCAFVPRISAGGINGYTYVLLGSIQGGRIIADHLRPLLGPMASFRFYSDGYSGFEAAWAQLAAELDTTSEDSLEEICITACAVFEMFDRWMPAGRSN